MENSSNFSNTGLICEFAFFTVSGVISKTQFIDGREERVRARNGLEPKSSSLA